MLTGFWGPEDSPDFSSLRIIKKFNTFQGWDLQWCKEARDAAHRIAAMEEPHFDHVTWSSWQKRLVSCYFRNGQKFPRLKIHMSTDNMM